jgi:hypothetical protein
MFIDDSKIYSINNTSNGLIPFTIEDMDLPNCDTLKYVTIVGKVSCPKLSTSSSASIRLTSVESMLYMVDSLPSLTDYPTNENVFTMSTASANEDIDLFNELNAELKAKGWTAGVTLTA